MAKKRLDIYIHETFEIDSRQLAQNYIIQGFVKVNGKEERKPGYYVKPDDQIVAEIPKKQFVSRGGIKLAHALDEFDIKPSNYICIDAGASTGGFTDCLLQRGAEKVYAVDVGKGQLDWSLRQNNKVIVIEDFNIRYIDSSTIPEKVDLITIDISFISINLALPPLYNLLKDNGIIVSLVKPQFEAGKGKTVKGVVKDKKIHVSVLENALIYGKNAGLYPVKCTWSPIKGPSGNIEFLMLYSKSKAENLCDCSQTVEQAWKFFEDKK